MSAVFLCSAAIKCILTFLALTMVSENLANIAIKATGAISRELLQSSWRNCRIAGGIRSSLLDLTSAFSRHLVSLSLQKGIVIEGLGNGNAIIPLDQRIQQTSAQAEKSGASLVLREFHVRVQVPAWACRCLVVMAVI
jgi:uncharacterized protein YheU (UPF0270 family)